MSYSTGSEEEASVDAGLLEFSVEDDELVDFSGDVYGAYPTWLTSFEQFARLYLPRAFQAITVLGEADDQTSGFRLMVNDATRLRLVQNHLPKRPITIIQRTDKELFDEAAVRTVAKFAANPNKIRLEYTLLLQAYSALTNMEYRQAVIDAATAVELAAGNFIRAQLPEQTGAIVTAKLQGLRNLLELAASLGADIPTIDSRFLYENRNLVAHKGKVPDYLEAAKFAQKAEGLVRIFSPEIAQR